jgi:hypothetical protein
MSGEDLDAAKAEIGDPSIPAEDDGGETEAISTRSAGETLVSDAAGTALLSEAAGAAGDSSATSTAPVLNQARTVLSRKASLVANPPRWLGYAAHALTAALVLGIGYFSSTQSHSTAREMDLLRQSFVTAASKARDAQASVVNLTGDIEALVKKLQSLDDTVARDRIKSEGAEGRVAHDLQRIDRATEELGNKLGELSGSLAAARDGANVATQEEVHAIAAPESVAHPNPPLRPAAFASAPEGAYQSSGSIPRAKPAAKSAGAAERTSTHEAVNSSAPPGRCPKVSNSPSGSPSSWWARIAPRLEETFGRPMFSVLHSCEDSGKV